MKYNKPVMKYNMIMIITIQQCQYKYNIYWMGAFMPNIYHSASYCQENGAGAW